MTNEYFTPPADPEEKTKARAAKIAELIDAIDTGFDNIPAGLADSIAALSSGSGVLVSATDTAIGYLLGKLVAGTNITLTQGSGGGNETLTINSASFLGANVFTGQQTFAETKDTVYDITDGAAFEIDPANGNIQTITLGDDRTPAATNFEAGQSMILGIDDGTDYTVTWTNVIDVWVVPGGTGEAPTLATTGYTWVGIWMVGSVVYGSKVGQP